MEPNSGVPREVALTTPDYSHLKQHIVLCVITNNPVTFSETLLKKKLNNQSYTETFRVFSKI